MATFTVKVEGAEELKFKLNEGIPKPLQGLMGKVRAKAQKEVKTRAKPHPGDVGTVANAIRSSLEKTPISGLRVPSGAKVSLYANIAREVEEGRSPGRPPSYRAMQRWAKRHSLNASPKNVQAMRQRIKLQGTRGVGMVEKGGEATMEALPAYIREAEAAIEREWNR